MAFDSERYEIRFMVKGDVDQVAKLFAEVYGEREPTISSLNMSIEEIYEKMGKSWVEQCYEEGLSLVCVDKTNENGNQIVGFRLSGVLDVKSIRDKKIDYSLEYQPEIAVGIYMSEFKVKWLEAHPEIDCDNLNEKYMMFLGLAVKKGYEDQQIGTTLIETSLKDARLRGFKCVVVICTAARSQYMFEHKFQFKRVYSRAFKDIEYNGYKYLESITEPKEIVLYELTL